ncbi:hypothetical protein [Achromobacter marplatensis]|uniref:hypothetical protein n=1 Tax=Achromobacter marplatensis TaxID=470868 RepID=UPI0028E45F1D|nr:hypothetical protein [Achromobacter marplatensis]
MRLSTFLYSLAGAWTFFYTPWFLVVGADWLIAAVPGKWSSLLGLWSVLLPVAFLVIASALRRREKVVA